jgi:hypothetical protein
MSFRERKGDITIQAYVLRRAEKRRVDACIRGLVERTNQQERKQKGSAVDRSCLSLLRCCLLGRSLLLWCRSLLCCGGLLRCSLLCGLRYSGSLSLGDTARLCLAEDTRYLRLDSGSSGSGLAGLAGVRLRLRGSSDLLRCSLCGCGLLWRRLLGGGSSSSSLGLLHNRSVQIHQSCYHDETYGGGGLLGRSSLLLGCLLLCLGLGLLGRGGGGSSRFRFLLCKLYSSRGTLALLALFAACRGFCWTRRQSRALLSMQWREVKW